MLDTYQENRIKIKKNIKERTDPLHRTSSKPPYPSDSLDN